MPTPDDDGRAVPPTTAAAAGGASSAADNDDAGAVAAGAARWDGASRRVVGPEAAEDRPAAVAVPGSRTADPSGGRRRRALRWVAAGRALVDGLAEAVFPRVCVDCRGPVDDDTPFRHLCENCGRGLPWIRRPACRVCGHPFFGVVEGERTCPHCDRLVPRFDAGASAVLLRGAARALVLELKYHGGRHVLEDMATVVRASSHILDHVRDATLVPVPLHPRKERERGFNQSQLIATVLAREAGGATKVRSLLRRTIDTVTQTAFDRERRRENLKNAFALASGATIVAGTRYVLVDDVFTTGSTLNSCAGALRDAGVVNLDVVTFGHG